MREDAGTDRAWCRVLDLPLIFSVAAGVFGQGVVRPSRESVGKVNVEGVGKRRAVVVGNDQCDHHGFPTLTRAEKDVANLARVLEERGWSVRRVLPSERG